MSKLVIKNGDDIIFEGEDIYHVDTSLPINEFHFKLMETCQDKLGMKFDHFLDSFYEFDNLIDNGQIDNITITTEE